MAKTLESKAAAQILSKAEVNFSSSSSSNSNSSAKLCLVNVRHKCSKMFNATRIFKHRNGGHRDCGTEVGTFAGILEVEGSILATSDRLFNTVGYQNDHYVLV